MLICDHRPVRGLDQLCWRVLGIAAACGAVALPSGCATPRDAGLVTLSFEERPGGCANCPHYRVEFSPGVVGFFGIAGCGVPGEQVVRVPPSTFTELRKAFDDARFFEIPRIADDRMIADAGAVTVSFRDDRRVHETIDMGRESPQLKQLQQRLRAAAQVVDEFIRPSIATYDRLLKSGWDVNIVGTDGENALTTAVARDPSVAGFLLQRGATGGLSTDAMFAAVEQNDSGLIPLLARYGAQVNARDRSGRTPLMAASDACKYWHIGPLLEAGADPFLADGQGRTALQPQTSIADET